MSLKLPNSRVGRALFLVVCVFVGAYGAYLVVTATDVDHAYRTSAPDSAPCQALRANPKALQESNNENDENDKNANDWWTCALQRHENSPLSGQPTISSLTKRPIHDPGAFHLAFVEFGEDGREIEPLQRDWLFEHLKKQKQNQKQNYVVTFVHGWRHDARRGDTNLKSFRTLLSYAKSALEHRCVEAGRYCDATLTGVFVGWRGQVLSHDWEGWLADLIAAPTFFTRKPTSDMVAGGVARFLKHPFTHVWSAPRCQGLSSA